MRGELRQGAFALNIAAKIYRLETALATQPRTGPGKSLAGTGEAALLSGFGVAQIYWLISGSRK